MNVKLWGAPHNGGYIWFSRKAITTCRIGWGTASKLSTINGERK
jgi:hypothetical protein